MGCKTVSPKDQILQTPCTSRHGIIVNLPLSRNKTPFSARTPSPEQRCCLLDSQEPVVSIAMRQTYLDPACFLSIVGQRQRCSTAAQFSLSTTSLRGGTKIHDFSTRTGTARNVAEKTCCKTSILPNRIFSTTVLDIRQYPRTILIPANRELVMSTRTP